MVHVRQLKVMKEQEWRRPFRRVLQECDGTVDAEIVDVHLRPDVLSVVPDETSHVRPVRAKVAGKVETRVGGITADVPFPRNRRAITHRLQDVRKGLLAGAKRRIETRDAVRAAVPASENRRAGRTAERHHDVSLGKPHAARREGVEIWRANVRIPVGAHRVEPLIIRQDDDEVRPRGWGGVGARRHAHQENDDQSPGATARSEAVAFLAAAWRQAAPRFRLFTHRGDASEPGRHRQNRVARLFRIQPIGA
jgi:hypothetical protein